VRVRSRVAARVACCAFTLAAAAALFGAPASPASAPSVLAPDLIVSSPAFAGAEEEAPIVTLNSPATPSNDLTPPFSGTATGPTAVTVEIFEGTRAEGELLAVATASGTGGAWTSAPASPSLPTGRRDFTAVAVQKSAVGDAVGTSAPVTFSVDTEPSAVTLAAPARRSNDPSPSFSGTAGEQTPVEVAVFAGGAAEGEIVATATADAPGPSGGWISADVTPSLPDGTFTAVATQTSALGNAAGTSNAVTFQIDTRPPSVTLNQLPSPSPGAAAIFSGTATDETPVTIDVHSGAGAGGPLVASTSAEVAGGEWASARLSPALAWGEYTAVATQASSIGNPAGTSTPMTFVVEPIAPAVATEGASAVTRTTAALYGLVDPLGGGVSSCAFEVGITTVYSQVIECGFVSEAMSAFPPAATAAVPVFVRIFGLTPSTTYHFRLAVVGEGGTARGDDAIFTTDAPFSFDEHPTTRPATTTTTTTATHGVAASRVAALIANQLTVPRRRGAISALLARGTFAMQFSAPEAGTVAVSWYHRRTSARSHQAGPSPSALAAFGRLSYGRASKRSVTIRLTGYGRRLLRHSKRVRLTATCSFTALGAQAVRVSRTFELSG
jgi:hypothetical protein